MPHSFVLYEKELDAARLEIIPTMRMLLVFALGDEWYSVDIQHVREVIFPPLLAPLPNVSRSISGVLNLRGTIVSIIDLKVCLGLTAHPLNKNGKIVVIESEGISAGLWVDGSTEILSIPPSKIEALIPTLTETETLLFEGEVEWKGKLIAILNVSQVLKKTSPAIQEANSFLSDLKSRMRSREYPREKKT